MSIQSSVAYGHVGNSAATFPLMRLGIEVWPVLTVHFSNHTGYGSWRGPLLKSSDVAEVVSGIDERGVLGRCDAVLSGYQGGEDVGAVILDTVKLIKERNPAAIYCCDPVMGDVGRGFFVRPGIPEFMRDHVVPAAQVITPNQFELEFLTGLQTTSVPDVLKAADAARAMGPETVLVTSVVHDAADQDTIDMIAVTGEGAWSVTTPLLPQTFTGAGDITAAMFLAHLLTTGDPAAAVSRTAAIVYGVLKTTVESGQGELQLVAAQEEIAAPSHTFEVTRLR
ncbi:pyridoxal kinase [Microlunatus panaciterrae]|nr:pyridoxal kinase PdxY [Microlunatus panaciterrae]